MTERRYLLDNNVLSRLTPGDRQGEFFKACCHVTSDVLYEARGYAEPEVAERVLPVTPAVLRLLSEVMATQQPGDIRLVNLYTNQGAADPTLIAVALQEQAAEDATLFAKRWGDRHRRPGGRSCGQGSLPGCVGLARIPADHPPHNRLAQLRGRGVSRQPPPSEREARACFGGCELHDGRD